MTRKLDSFTESYIETALWSSIDDAGNPLDEIDAELSTEAIERFVADCAKFQKEYVPVVTVLGYSSEDFRESQLAHDFWLTRNGHGAGFWDGDYPKEVGEDLTTLAKKYGECDLYVGDDGQIYVY